jgi:hypothetical protein
VLVYPAACRRTGLSLSRFVNHSILPAVWPALVLAALYAVVPLAHARSLGGLALESLIGGLVYAALFWIAIGRHDRVLYRRLAGRLLTRVPHPEPHSRTSRVAEAG